jgi:acyl carrier protein
MDPVRDRVIRVISEVTNTPAEEVARAHEFTQLERWDSLLYLNTILAIEKEFGVRFEIDELSQVNSIPGAIDLVAKKLSSGGV